MHVHVAGNSLSTGTRSMEFLDSDFDMSMQHYTQTVSSSIIDRGAGEVA